QPGSESKAGVAVERPHQPQVAIGCGTHRSLTPSIHPPQPSPTAPTTSHPRPCAWDPGWLIIGNAAISPSNLHESCSGPTRASLGPAHSPHALRTEILGTSPRMTR